MTERRAVERETWQALRSLVLDRNDRKREVCEALDMSFVRVKALGHLATRQLTMRELATVLGTDPPYTTLVVDDLEERGLVVRTPHPEDRRAKVVTVTAGGKRAARKAELILGTPPVSMRGLSMGELAELQRLVASLLA